MIETDYLEPSAEERYFETWETDSIIPARFERSERSARLTAGVKAILARHTGDRDMTITETVQQHRLAVESESPLLSSLKWIDPEHLEELSEEFQFRAVRAPGCRFTVTDHGNGRVEALRIVIWRQRAAVVLAEQLGEYVAAADSPTGEVVWPEYTVEMIRTFPLTAVGKMRAKRFINLLADEMRERIAQTAEPVGLYDDDTPFTDTHAETTYDGGDDDF